mmetsp:Transcript_4832/g.10225  ORF Transcript_4832/g.10225 Transcript_4832/m.10225 type:complete len:257 (-) Transcript_4832:126-896(-)
MGAVELHEAVGGGAHGRVGRLRQRVAELAEGRQGDGLDVVEPRVRIRAEAEAPHAFLHRAQVSFRLPAGCHPRVVSLFTILLRCRVVGDVDGPVIEAARLPHPEQEASRRRIQQQTLHRVVPQRFDQFPVGQVQRGDGAVPLLVHGERAPPLHRQEEPPVGELVVHDPREARVVLRPLDPREGLRGGETVPAQLRVGVPGRQGRGRGSDTRHRLRRESRGPTPPGGRRRRRGAEGRGDVRGGEHQAEHREAPDFIS